MNFDTTENLYIEGDNLEVLKLLQETYLGKVKMIYIDPPYNTGNDSFLYNDNYTETMSDFSIRNKNKDEFGNIIYDIRVNNNTNGRFHTDWLNMMYSRLKLTRNLLCEDGVLFISIDNNEVSNLKKICDEIFGENSFITIIHVQMSTVQGQKVKAAKAGNIVKNGEYILVYSKNGKKDIGKKPLFDPVKYDNHYNKFLLENEDGSFSEKSLVEIIGNEKEILDELVVLGLISSTKKVISSTKLQEYYELSPTFKKFINNNASKIVRVHDSIDIDSSFKALMKVDCVYNYKSESRNYLVAKNDKNIVSQRISIADKLNEADDFYKTFGPTTIRGDWWSGFYLDMGNVSKEGEVNYDNGKKPVRLIRQLIEFCTSDEDIILDFFSGSATTAHAVLETSKYFGKRKFIMVQLDEDLDGELAKATGENKKIIKNTIKFLDENNLPHKLSEIGKERIRRVIKKLKKEKLEFILDEGFRVLKCDTSNMKDVYYNPSQYQNLLFDSLENNIKEDRTSEDLLFQVMLDLGILLSSKIEEKIIAGKKVFKVEENYLIACFDNDVTEETIKAIAEQKPYYFVMRDSSMANDSVATNFEQIFATYSPDTIRRVL